MMRSLPALTLAAAAAIGCGRTDNQVAGATAFEAVTDTIGDTIVVRTARAASDTAARAVVEELRIGRLDGPDEYIFGSIEDVAVGPKGDIYVLDVQSKVIRQYDSAGVYVRRFGRAGDGPGDFNEANGIAVLPDGRVALWEPVQHRINVYDATGRPIDTWPIPGAVRNRIFTFRYAVRTDTAGHVVLTTGDGYVRFDGRGQVVDTLRWPVWTEEPVMISATKNWLDENGMKSTSTSSRAIPWTPMLAHEWSPLGFVVAGRTDRYSVDQMRIGAPWIRIEREALPIPVEPERADEMRKQLTDEMRRIDPEWKWTGPEIPKVKPFFSGISVGLDGRIWLYVSSPMEKVAVSDTTKGGSGSTRWRWRSQNLQEVFEPDGRYLGAVQMPALTNVITRRGNHSWAIGQDSLGVPFVVRYRIEPPFPVAR